MPGQCLKAPFSLTLAVGRCVDRACVRERPGIRGASGTVLYRLIACQVGDIRRSRARRPRSSRVRDFRANGGNEQGMHAVSTATGGHRHVRRELTLFEFSGGRPDSFRTG